MLRTFRNFNKPEDFADECRETMKTFEDFAQYLRDTDHEAGQTGMLLATEYEAKMEHHLDDAEQRLSQLRIGIESIIDDLISYGNTLRLDQLELRDAIQALQENWMVRSLQTNDAVKSIVGNYV